MGEIVNLRRFRKDKARADDARQAESNRLKFGRSKSEKQRTSTEQDAARRQLDGHKLAEQMPDTPDPSRES